MLVMAEEVPESPRLFMELMKAAGIAVLATEEAVVVGEVTARMSRSKDRLRAADERESENIEEGVIGENRGDSLQG